MKLYYIVVLTIAVGLTACAPKNGVMITKDKDGSKMLVGKSNKDALMNDKAFAWFKEGYDKYQPDAKAVKSIKAVAPSIKIEVFGGTWCDDTHDLLPGFYKAMDAAGIADSQITLHLVNRDKKTKDGSADKYGITNVPTFIVFIKEKEAGKIVESAKTTIEGDIATMLVNKE